MTAVAITALAPPARSRREEAADLQDLGAEGVNEQTRDHGVDHDVARKAWDLKRPRRRCPVAVSRHMRVLRLFALRFLSVKC